MAMGRTRYRAAGIKQRITFQGKLIGCTDTAFAMCVDGATTGGCIVTEHIVRSLSNEANPDPNSPGLNLNQIVAVAAKLHVKFSNLTGKAWSDVETALDNNAKAVLQLWYSEVGGTNIGHAFYADQILNGRVHCVDPIKGTYGWYAINDVRRAMTVFSQKAGGSGLYFGITKRAPWISTLQTAQVAK